MSSPEEFGWRVHQTIQVWTTSVDTKASIVVVIETATAGAAAKALITEKGELSEAVGWQLAASSGALLLLILAVTCALAVVYPRLDRSEAKRLEHDGLIYFGHLRARSAADIKAALDGLTASEEHRQLARQLRIMSVIAWRKHAFLHWSLRFFGAGALLLVIAFLADGRSG